MVDSGKWTQWRGFPDPRRRGYLEAPLGPGVYELRDTTDGRLVYCGCGGNVTYRMTSLLPRPLGAGTRNNRRLREYVLSHLVSLEYRTAACSSREEAADLERDLRARGEYLF